MRSAWLAVLAWWRTTRRIDAWTPGRSKLERLRRLNDEMVWRED